MEFHGLQSRKSYLTILSGLDLIGKLIRLSPLQELVRTFPTIRASQISMCNLHSTHARQATLQRTLSERFLESATLLRSYFKACLLNAQALTINKEYSVKF
jgi:hypothetical protein